MPHSNIGSPKSAIFILSMCALMGFGGYMLDKQCTRHMPPQLKERKYCGIVLRKVSYVDEGKSIYSVEKLFLMRDSAGNKFNLPVDDRDYNTIREGDTACIITQPKFVRTQR